MIQQRKDEIKILTPVGNIGYGYDKSLFWSAIRDGVDAIICDSGSTDSGPSRLGLGKLSAPKDAFYKDLEPYVEASATHNVPVLIGSAGGAGTNAQVDQLVELIVEIVKTRGFRTMRVVKIYSDIDKELVRQEHDAGRIVPCGQGVLPLQSADIDNAVTIVAQMGLEPYKQAMIDYPDFDIIIGGRAYDPAPFAAFCLSRGFEDLGIAYHMGKICECGAQCATPKSRAIVATVRHSSFDLTPMDPASRCTAVSVAAHALYEKSRPDILPGPGGALHLKDSTYEELSDGRSVRVRGAKFLPVNDGEYTIKLEAARIAGYQSTFFGGIMDPILISQIDVVFSRVRQYVAAKCPFPHDLKLTTYGHGDSVSMFKTSNHERPLPSSIAICGQSRAATQEQANEVVNAARVGCVHSPYPGQKATAGNFAMPSFDIPLGKACKFCIYHLMVVQDPTKAFPSQLTVIPGLKEAKSSDGFDASGTEQAQPVRSVSVNGWSNKPVPKLQPTLSPDYCYLGEFASVVRSKNCGPFELTFDVMFDSVAKYEHIKASGTLSQSSVAKMYNLNLSEVFVALWWDQALAFKFTVKRPIVSGSFGETDTHGSCQHVPLMYLQIPAMK